MFISRTALMRMLRLVVWDYRGLIMPLSFRVFLGQILTSILYHAPNLKLRPVHVNLVHVARVVGIHDVNPVLLVRSNGAAICMVTYFRCSSMATFATAMFA